MRPCIALGPHLRWTKARASHCKGSTCRRPLHTGTRAATATPRMAGQRTNAQGERDKAGCARKRPGSCYTVHAAMEALRSRFTDAVSNHTAGGKGSWAPCARRDQHFWHGCAHALQHGHLDQWPEAPTASRRAALPVGKADAMAQDSGSRPRAQAAWPRPQSRRARCRSQTRCGRRR